VGSRTSWRIVTLAGLVLLGLLFEARAEPKAPVDPGLAASDAALVQDEAKATAELQRRLHAQVSYHNGVLIIIDHSGTNSGVTVVPATIMWGVDCSDGGVAVTFGSGSGDTDNGIVLQLTSTPLSDEKCLKIAPAIGEAVLSITKGE
jgi:hypothetical protein